MNRAEINEMFEEQIRLIAERSQNADDMSLAALTEQMESLGKMLMELDCGLRPKPPYIP